MTAAPSKYKVPYLAARVIEEHAEQLLGEWALEHPDAPALPVPIEQDQSKATASVKSVLGLADSTDSKWPVAPSTDPAAPPEKLTKGVLESDPFAPIVEGIDDPAALVSALESAGWQAAWIDIWDEPCDDVVVLDIGFDEDGDPINPDPDVWKNPKPASPTYHPGAAFCMRSNCPDVDGGPGQQCCYDSSGNLVTVGGGAGTPDIIAPCGPFDAIGHNEEDVQSYNRCKRAGMLDCYLRHRPPNNGNGCACNPPTHPHCTEPPSDASCDCD